MTTRDDALKSLEPPDRLYYATGVFLDAEDLSAEQAYHRGRLARQLDYLHGSGTAAGLQVTFNATKDEIEVGPGLAIDRLGRLIELPRTACMDVGRWFEYWRQQLADPAATPGEGAFASSLDINEEYLVADVHLRFLVHERGRTPSFATGPFDALDATVPSRLRDGWELRLTPRGDDPATLPQSPWPERAMDEDMGAYQRRLQDTVLGAWHHGTQDWDGDTLKDDASTAGVGDSTAVFLARIRIPVTVPSNRIPVRRDAAVLVDNHVRRFVYSTDALVRWLQAVQGSFRL
jgi:hypothetical protein